MLLALLLGLSWSDLNRAASEAIKANDYARLKAVLLELRPLMPGNPRVMYNLAASDARLGETAAAIAGLKDLAATGLIYDVKADDDFAPLAGHAEFAGIVARFEQNKRPVTHSQLARQLAEADLIPESIVHASKRFLVSSVRKSKILTADGGLFAKTEWPAYALAIDERRRLLWASMGTEEGQSALLAFDLASGKPPRRVDHTSKGLLGDMAIGPSGELFVTGGGIFRLPVGESVLERIDQPGEFPSPQTPAVSPDGKTLYVPDYLRGIAAINLATRHVTWMQPAPGIATSGIDGLYLHRGKFIAIQNGTRPPRVMEFSLDLQRQRVLEANWPGLGEPTHGAFVGDDFYFLANTGWDTYKKPNARPVLSSIRRLKLP